jgi:anti-anti-sigma factor
MLFKCSKQDDISVVTVDLKRATVEAAPVFKESLFKVIENRNSKIIVDFSNCEFIDSTFLGVLVSAYKKSVLHKENLIMVWDDNKFSSLISLTNLHRVFKIYGNLNQAIHHFKK